MLLVGEIHYHQLSTQFWHLRPNTAFSEMNANNQKSVLVIHDASRAPACWRNIRVFYELRGMHVIEPDVPGWSGRAISDLLRLYSSILSTQPEMPLLVGFGRGGLIVQYLLDAGYGAAGIAICPESPNHPRPVLISRFFLPPANLDDLPPLDYLNATRSPLLLVAGAKDIRSRSGDVRRDFWKYRESKAITDFFEFPEQSHRSVLERGWKEIAEFTLNWGLSNARAIPVPSAVAAHLVAKLAPQYSAEALQVALW